MVLRVEIVFGGPAHIFEPSTEAAPPFVPFIGWGARDLSLRELLVTYSRRARAVLVNELQLAELKMGMPETFTAQAVEQPTL